jgi:hypothetical protein
VVEVGDTFVVLVPGSTGSSTGSRTPRRCTVVEIYQVLRTISTLDSSSGRVMRDMSLRSWYKHKK